MAIRSNRDAWGPAARRPEFTEVLHADASPGPAPCERCGASPPSLFFVGGRLLCGACCATQAATQEAEPKRQGRIDACFCGLCTAPVLPGFEYKAR